MKPDSGMHIGSPKPPTPASPQALPLAAPAQRTPKAARAPLSPRPVAAIAFHPDGAAAVVILSHSAQAPNSHTNNTYGLFNVIETLEIAPGSDAVPLFLSLAAKHQAVARIVVTRHDEVVARVAQVPAASPEVMAAAANLLAEAQLPATIPLWRRTGGVVQGKPRAGMRYILLTGWVARTETTARWQTHPHRRHPKSAGSQPPSDVTFCTPLAALAMLMGDSHAGAYIAPSCQPSAQSPSAQPPSAHPPSLPSIPLTPHHPGAGILVLSGENSSVRIMIADQDESPLVQAARALRTAAASLAQDEIPDISGPICITPHATSALAATLRGITLSPDWLATFGLPLGAALTAFTPGASALGHLLSQPAPIIESAPVRAATWLARGKRPALLLALGLFALLVFPWLLAHARDQFLTARASTIERMKKENADVEKRAALFTQLDINRWPLTKILSDLSSATPIGVVAVDIRLNPEQGLTFDGTADKPELVTSFQGNLTSTRLFRNVKVNRTESSGEGAVGFNLTAEVAAIQAHAPISPIEDFAAKTLAVRLHGDAPAGTAAPAAPAKPATPARRGDNKQADADAEKRPGISTDSLPPPVTDEDIKKMDLPTARREWIARKVYSQKNPTQDAATKQRLLEEETKIRAHAAATPAPPPKPTVEKAGVK